MPSGSMAQYVRSSQREHVGHEKRIWRSCNYLFLRSCFCGSLHEGGIECSV
jgi:hypothetical protein